MSNKKQTAVEWLAEQMMHPQIYNPYIDQAKEMEKQQMKIIFIDSREIDCECDIWNCKGDAKKYESFEQYYQKTYEL